MGVLIFVKLIAILMLIEPCVKRSFEADGAKGSGQPQRRTSQLWTYLCFGRMRQVISGEMTYSSM